MSFSPTLKAPCINLVVPLFRDPTVEAQTRGPPYNGLRRQLNGQYRSYRVGFITFEDLMAIQHDICSNADRAYANWKRERDVARHGKRRASNGSSTLKSARSSVGPVEASQIRKAMRQSRINDGPPIPNPILPIQSPPTRSGYPVQMNRIPSAANSRVATHVVTPPSRPVTNPDGADSQPGYSSSPTTSSIPIIPWKIPKYPHFIESPAERRYEELYNNFMVLQRFCRTVETRLEREIILMDEAIGHVNDGDRVEEQKVDDQITEQANYLLTQFMRVLDNLDGLNNRATALVQEIYGLDPAQPLYQHTIALLRCIKRLRNDIATLNDERMFAQQRIGNEPLGKRDPRRDEVLINPTTDLTDVDPNLDENPEGRSRLFSPFFFPNLNRMSYIAGWLPYTDVIAINKVADGPLVTVVCRTDANGKIVAQAPDRRHTATGAAPGDPDGDPSDHNSDISRNPPTPRSPCNHPLPPSQPSSVPMTHVNTPAASPVRPTGWGDVPSPFAPPRMSPVPPQQSTTPVHPPPSPTPLRADDPRSGMRNEGYGNGDRGFGRWYRQRSEPDQRNRSWVPDPPQGFPPNPPPIPTPGPVPRGTPTAQPPPADAPEHGNNTRRTRFQFMPGTFPGAGRPTPSPPPPPPPNNSGNSGNTPNPGGDPSDPGNGSDNHSHRSYSPHRRHAGPVRASQEPEDRQFDRSSRHNRYEPLPDKDFPGINALYFNDEEEIWIQWTHNMNSRRAGAERSMFGRAKSSATADVMEALDLHKEDQGGKGLLVTAGYKPEFDSATVFTGKDVTTTSFEDFIGQVLEFMDMTNILGPGANYDKARVQVLGSRLRQDARTWYNNHVTRKQKDWTFLHLVQGLESEFLKYSTFDMNKAYFDSFAQLPGKKAISAYQRLQLYSRGMLYEANPYEIKYRFYWGLREDVRCSLTHDNATPKKDDWSIRDMLKQAINIEHGFDAAKTPRQVINQLAIPNGSKSESSPASGTGMRPTSDQPKSNAHRDDRHRSSGHGDRRHSNQHREPNRPQNDPPRDQLGRYQPRTDDRNHSRDPARHQDTAGPKDKSSDTCHQCGEKGHWRGDPACKKANLNHAPPVRRYHRVGIQSPAPSELEGSHHARARSFTASDIAETALDLDVNPNDNMSDGFYASVQCLKLR